MLQCLALLIILAAAVQDEDLQNCTDEAAPGLLLLQTPDLKVQPVEVPVHPGSAKPGFQDPLFEEENAIVAAVESAIESLKAKWPNAADAQYQTEGQTETWLTPEDAEAIARKYGAAVGGLPTRNISVSVTLKRKTIGATAHTFRALMVAGLFIVLVSFAGTMSGLSLGLLQIRETDIEVLQRSNDPGDREMGASLGSALQDRHLVLVTLLLCNAIAAEILPLVLNVEMNAVAAAIAGIMGLLIGGEILPQAIFSAASMSTISSFTPLVKALMWLTYPISRPVATILDLMFNENKRPFDVPRQALSAMMHLQHQKGILSAQEARILEGAMGLAAKKVSTCMTKLEAVSVLAEDAEADLRTMEHLRKLNRSRIPVHSADDRRILVSVVICKSLVGIHPKDGYKIRDLADKKSLLHVHMDASLSDALALLQGSVSRMAVVYDKTVAISDSGQCPGVPAVGIVTMNDIVEQLLMSEIKDEGQRLDQRFPSIGRSRSHDGRLPTLGRL